MRSLCNEPAVITPRWQKQTPATLEVMDTAELMALNKHLSYERKRLRELYRIAKEERRPVIAKNAEFDLMRIDKCERWIRHVLKDTRRTW